MYNGEQLKAFWKHWNLTPDDDRELGRFRVRVLAVMRNTWERHIAPSERARTRFALISGTPFLDFESGDFDCTEIDEVLGRDSTLIQVLEQIQFVLWTIESEKPRSLTEVSEWLNEAFDASPGISVHLVNHNGKATLCPMGVRLLDEAVIEGNLVWLEKYPDAAKPFETALRLYSRKDPSNFRNLLDSLRLSVEQVLRAVLNNRKSLEHQKEEFLRWLSVHDAHSQIGKIYHHLLFVEFAQYHNDAVKHNEDKYTAAEVEFMLYLTGTLLRFIQRVDETSPSTNAE